MSEVTKKSDTSSSQMRLLGGTPHIHIIIFERYLIFEPWVALQAAGWIAEPSCHSVAVGSSLLTLSVVRAAAAGS